MSDQTSFEGESFDSIDKLDSFFVEVDGFEGPLDILLSMARDQKVDITQISILALAEQYLIFITTVSDLNLDLAADYLVMAAWLAYLKSRLLLPDLTEEGEPTGPEMAAALQYQLRRLQSMQDAGKKLMNRPQLGNSFYARGDPEFFCNLVNTVYETSLFDLLKSYGEQKRRKIGMEPLKIESFQIFTVEEAIGRLRKLLGPIPGWTSLWEFLPDGLKGTLLNRSAVATTFAASLELAKEEGAILRQSKIFGPIHINAGIHKSKISR
jgi:segregation and condensation protein A